MLLHCFVELLDIKAPGIVVVEDSELPSKANHASGSSALELRPNLRENILCVRVDSFFISKPGTELFAFLGDGLGLLSCLAANYGRTELLIVKETTLVLVVVVENGMSLFA